MNKSIKMLCIALLSLGLLACGKKNEPCTYGIKNSKWNKMNAAQKKEAQDRYEHEIRVSERRKMELEFQEQKEQENKLRIEQRLSSLENKQTSQSPTTVIIQQPQTQAQPIYIPTPAPVYQHAPNTLAHHQQVQVVTPTVSSNQTINNPVDPYAY